MNNRFGVSVVERVDGRGQCVDEGGGQGIGAVRAANEARLRGTGERVQGSPCFLDGIVTAAAEGAPNDIEERSDPFAPHSQSETIDACVEGEAGEGGSCVDGGF
jgi:hypothetical protein